ncbi:hypothetical protein F5878DRAFT_16318, partial [Lentinula raphanica]
MDEDVVAYGAHDNDDEVLPGTSSSQHTEQTSLHQEGSDEAAHNSPSLASHPPVGTTSSVSSTTYSLTAMNNMAARLLEAQRTFQQQLTAFQTSAPTLVTTAPASARVGAILPIGQPSATSVHRPEKPSSALTSSTPRATTSSKPSRASPKSSTATNCNTAKLPRSSTLPPTISYPPSTTLERSPVGKETASARITRVEHNTIRIDQRIDLLLTGLEDRIGQEV